MIIVSGLSGAGKTIALNALEDLGFYCIDNLPMSLLPALSEEQKSIEQPVAVGLDIRSHSSNQETMPAAVARLQTQTPEIKMLFLTASSEMLVKRFSETRRKHPLSIDDKPLADAIVAEQQLLSPLLAGADLHIDTSVTNIYELKDRIIQWLAIEENNQPVLTVESFGFKNGVPVDADLMFDVRFLPNPHWESELRTFTGQDVPIQNYLGQYDESERFVADTTAYLSRWVDVYFSTHRTYLTVAIGCTGGKHRSVYISEQIAERLSAQFGHINIRHRDLPRN